MAATVTDIARLTRENTVVYATTSNLHGAAARDNSSQPIVTSYDIQGAATSLVTTRLTLLSNSGAAERKLVEITVSGIVLPTGSLAANLVTPTVFLEDTPSRLSGRFAVVGFAYDLANERTTLTLFG